MRDMTKHAESIICAYCNVGLEETKYTEGFRFVLRTEEIPSKGTMISMINDEPIENPKYFCDRMCIDFWLDTWFFRN